MTEPGSPGEAVIGPLRPVGGLTLLGEYQGSGFTEPRFLVRRGDGQVIQLSRLLYLVAEAIAAAGAADGGWDADSVAARVRASYGRDITADNVRYLVAGKLAPLGVVVASAPTPRPVLPGYAVQQAESAPQQPPRLNLLLGLKVRGVLLRPRAAGGIGRALAWLHHPLLTVAVLSGFAAFETWLFAVHGAIGPLLGILRDPVLFLAVAGLTLASLLFHEFGHASACRYGGARPGVIGFGLYLVWPSLYTDVTDAYRLNRSGRLRTDLGGVYFNAIFILALGACYAVTGQPVFLAAAFLDNFQILQQLFPFLRMDGYFILGDLAGIPDLLGLLGPIMASVMPWYSARRAGARARTLRRGPRVVVTAWVLVTIPLLAAAIGYMAWNLPALVATASQSFTASIIAARTGFSADRPATGVAALLSVVLLLIPVAGLAYLLARVTARGAATVRRRQASRRQLLRVALGAMAVLSAVAVGVARLETSTPPAPRPGITASATATRAQAAAWIAGQISPDVTVSCDPQMCGQLRKAGFPAARLMAVRPRANGPLGSAVVVATPVIRDQFGARLAAVYAPLVIAGFGSGAQRVDIRAVAPDGAAAFASQLASEHASLVAAGKQLVRNKNIQVLPPARAALLAGHVDPRLFATLSALASQTPIRLMTFDALPPGASPVIPLPGAELSAASPASVAAILAFLRAQRAPYLPEAVAATRGPAGQQVVTVRFGAPGLMDAGGS